MTEQQTQEDLTSLLEGLEIDGLIDLEDTPQKKPSGGQGVEGLEVEQPAFGFDDDDKLGLPKTATAPACISVFDSIDPWTQAAANTLLTMPTAPEVLPRLSSLPTPEATFPPQQARLSAEDLERDLLMGVNYSVLPQQDQLEALMLNPFMQQVDPSVMMLMQQPNPLMQNPLALNEEEDSGGKKRRRRRRRPKKDRRDDPAYWESRPPADQCMIVPISEGAESIAATA